MILGQQTMLPDEIGLPFAVGDSVRWASGVLELDPKMGKGTWTVTEIVEDPLDSGRFFLTAEGSKGRISTRWPKGETPRVERA